MASLAATGESARAGRTAALEGTPSAEARSRLEKLLGQLDARAVSPEAVRQLRALEVLEQVGNSPARGLLRHLAGGAPGAILTVEARAALNRLGRGK